MTAVSGVLGLVLYVLLQGELQGFSVLWSCAPLAAAYFGCPLTTHTKLLFMPVATPAVFAPAFLAMPFYLLEPRLAAEGYAFQYDPAAWPRCGHRRTRGGSCAFARSRSCAPIPSRVRVCAVARFWPVPFGRDRSPFRRSISNGSLFARVRVVDRSRLEVVAVTGFEPVTFELWVRCSTRLSYTADVSRYARQSFSSSPELRDLEAATGFEPATLDLQSRCTTGCATPP